MVEDAHKLDFALYLEDLRTHDIVEEVCYLKKS